MLTGNTIQGSPFQYSGSLEAGLVISFKHAAMRITPEIISVIRSEITKRSPVLLGSCRKPLVPNSIGETLWIAHRVTPQMVSYVVPLLVQEGFCTVTPRKPFIVNRNMEVKS